MPRGKQSKGTCSYCGTIVTKSSMPKHLADCPERQKVIEDAERGQKPTETLYYLRAQDIYSKEYWLDLEMPGSKTLNNLDSYLRHIWLECCGHMSQFSIGGWKGKEIPMSRKIGQVFLPGIELIYIYDFGTSSETSIKLIGTREGKPVSKHPVVLMARNVAPEYQCIECEKPATRLCMECIIEADEFGTLCNEHAESHPHDDYGEPIELVNSPRVGMCGYTGPAEPPY